MDGKQKLKRRTKNSDERYLLSRSFSCVDQSCQLRCRLVMIDWFFVRKYTLISCWVTHYCIIVLLRWLVCSMIKMDKQTHHLSRHNSLAKSTFFIQQRMTEEFCLILIIIGQILVLIFSLFFWLDKIIDMKLIESLLLLCFRQNIRSSVSVFI